METTIALINVYQNRENYAWVDGDVDTQNPRWKMKGSTDELVLIMGETAYDVMGEKMALALANAASEEMTKPNGCYEYDLIETVIEVRDWALMLRVLENLVSESGKLSVSEGFARSEDMGYVIFCCDKLNLSESTMKWAIDSLIERGYLVTEGFGHSRSLVASDWTQDYLRSGKKVSELN
jgi:hypothetical protein